MAASAGLGLRAFMKAEVLAGAAVAMVNPHEIGKGREHTLSRRPGCGVMAAEICASAAGSPTAKTPARRQERPPDAAGTAQAKAGTSGRASVAEASIASGRHSARP